MMLIRTYIAPSTVQGIGVFSEGFVPKGTLLWSLHEKLDVLMSQSDISALPPHMQDFVRVYSYPHLEREGYVVVDSDNGRFMNHSEAPNTDFRHFDKGFALYNIQPGEEVTCDYREFIPGFGGFGPDGEWFYEPVPSQTELPGESRLLHDS